MKFLYAALKVAELTQKTLTAISASIVITVGVYEYLKKRKQNDRNR